MSNSFSHRVYFPCQYDGNDIVDIEITFDGTYTIQFTHQGPCVACKTWPNTEVSFIRDIPYLPPSLLYMISTAGKDGSVRKLIQILHKVCSEIQKEKKEIETNLESENRQLRAELESSKKQIEELQLTNQELVDQLIFCSTSLEQRLDIMLESAFVELHM